MPMKSYEENIQIMTNKTSIQVTYSVERLRTLVEEFITMQKHEFTFKDLCSYVLYWAKEEGKTANNGLYESNELDKTDSDRLARILEKIVKEGRIAAADDNKSFQKMKD